MTVPRSTHDRLIGLFTRLQALGLGQPRFKQKGLSLPQFGLLMCILQSPGIRLNQVAEMLGVSTPTVSVAVRKLESEGWLRRKLDPADRRAARLFLSAKARILAKQVAARRRRYVNEFMESLTPGEQEQLLSLLEKAITNLEGKRSLPNANLLALGRK
ncbi:MAG: MarR family transcriptional regulator [Anaerolineales bacterium]